jgi:hypothetical protein
MEIIRGVNLSENRIGQVRKNKFGSLMEVVEYNDCKDIWVKFLDNGNKVHTLWKHFLSGSVKSVHDKTVHGVGYIGEGIYKPSLNGKKIIQYKIWADMIRRCYNDNYHKNQPTYKDCSVSDEWHNFQNFAAWYDKNYYEIEDQRICLDKDILVKGNKVYSPDTCVFVPQVINNLFVKKDASRGSLPIGVSFDNKIKKYISHCNYQGKTVHLGCYDTVNDAFLAYKEAKEELIKQTANEYKNKIPDNLFVAMLKYEVHIND